MLEFGIDELTVVLQLNTELKDNLKIGNWYAYAIEMIDTFARNACFTSVFGDKIIMEKKLPEGYTNGFSFGEHNFYLSAAYHDMRVDMGVVIRFSAQALDYYVEKSGIMPYELLKYSQDELYVVRLSRVDLTVDYIDEDIDVTSIYNDLMQRKIGIFRETIGKNDGKRHYRRIDFQLRGILRETEVPTIYIGSAHSNSRLRIYEKRLEQIERRGSKIEKALKCNDWVRFEGVFRNEYAHQISDELLDIDSIDEYTNLIACTMIQKYKFLEVEDGVVLGNAFFSELLINCITSGKCILTSPQSRNYDLARSICYLMKDSGLISTLFRIKSIWGDTAFYDLQKLVNKSLSDYKPNDDCKLWLKKNLTDYSVFYGTFSDFINNNLKHLL